MTANIHSLQRRRDEIEILNSPHMKAHRLLFSASKSELVQIVLSFAADIAREMNSEEEDYLKELELEEDHKEWAIEEGIGFEEMYRKLGHIFIADYFERTHNRDGKVRQHRN